MIVVLLLDAAFRVGFLGFSVAELLLYMSPEMLKCSIDNPGLAHDVLWMRNMAIA